MHVEMHSAYEERQKHFFAFWAWLPLKISMSTVFVVTCYCPPRSPGPPLHTKSMGRHYLAGEERYLEGGKWS